MVEHKYGNEKRRSKASFFMFVVSVKTSKTIGLSNFSKAEMNILNETLNISANIINDLLNNGIDYIMNNYNK